MQSTLLFLTATISAIIPIFSFFTAEKYAQRKRNFFAPIYCFLATILVIYISFPIIGSDHLHNMAPATESTSEKINDLEEQIVYLEMSFLFCKMSFLLR